MSSIIIDHEISNKLHEYKSIFEHYGLERSLQNSERNIEDLFESKNCIREKNENNKVKKINAKTVNKKSKKKTPKTSPMKSTQSQRPKDKSTTKDHDKVIKLTVPDAAKARKASPTGIKHEVNKSLSSTKPSPSIPTIAVHGSSSTIKTAQELPSFQSSTGQSSPYIPSSASSSIAATPSPSQLNTERLIPATKKSSHDLESIWDLDEINEFTRRVFIYSDGYIKPNTGPHRPRLNCVTDQDDSVKKYVQSRSHCLDVFEEYVTSLKRQHGVIRDAAVDPPIFDPGVSITGPEIKKDPSVIDKEDSEIIKKLNKIEPRKKYALVHEQIGIYVLGGYNLFVDVPTQREPPTDYLFKFTGETIKVPPLTPCRANFGIYTDGEAIYIAGGQTIHNELLDDIQRLNTKTLKWEHIATLMNPIAACGMTLDNDRIYIVGGYDIIQNRTTLLSDYTIYNLSTRQFEKSTDLPSPRCRSLVFATDHALFCISGLIETLNENKNKIMTISTDILKWSLKMPLWIKVSQTPELTKFHALSFNDPYLEITKRILDGKGVEIDSITEAYYDFRANTWANGRAPTDTEPTASTKTETKSTLNTPNKNKTSMTKTPSKHKSSTKNKSPSQNRSPSKQKSNRKSKK